MNVTALRTRIVGADRAAVARAAVAFFPVLLIVGFAWVRRWTADDAFINFRIVRQVQNGNGPVFNIGDRVEAGTSPLWIFILAVVDVFLPLPLEWIAVVLSIAGTALGVGLAVAGARRLHLREANSEWLFPLGAMVYVSLPVAWDFSTSGLETGLSICWIGASWYVLTRWAAHSAGLAASAESTHANAAPTRLTWPVCLLLGAGMYVRPDFLIFTVCFGAAVLWMLRGQRRRQVHSLLWLLVLPVVGTLARMAYYGLPVPNTAIAKEASMPSWQRGWWYLQDLFDPYLLWLSLVLVLVVFAWPLLRRNTAVHPFHRVLTVAALFGGLLHGFYIVRLGGDFMHGRMLLPTVFALICPVAVARVRGWRTIGLYVIAAWSVVCMISLRTPYSTYSEPGKEPRIIDAISPATNIGDERIVFRRLSGRGHPVTLDDFANSLWGFGAEQTSNFLDRGGTGFIVDTQSNGNFQVYPLAQAQAERTKAVVYVGALGIYAYRLPRDVWVIDRFGLSNALSAHQRLTGRGRPGHEKDLPIAWLFAEYTVPGLPLPARIDPAEVEAARAALRCGGIPGLLDAQRASLGVSRVFRNATGSLSRWRFRMPTAPLEAAAELCR